MSISEQDKIGREEFVNKICGLVDSLNKNENFCLAINGAWGSGKTFVLDMIAKQLSQKQEYIIIKYDAWENSFYPDPLIAILYCILDSLKLNSKVKNLQRKKALKKYIKKVFVQKLDESIDKIVNELYKIGGWAGVAAYAVEKIKSIIKETKNSILDNKLFDDFKSYQKLIQEFYSVANKLTGYEKEVGKQTKLVVLVDEIDRCLPDEQLKILERLHHLFKVNNCAVIVAMNCACVAKVVKNIYDMDGSEYLRKFFSITYKLDAKSDDFLFNIMKSIEENVRKFNSNYQERNNVVVIACGFILAAQNTLKLSASINNREIKEFYDCVETIVNDLGWENVKNDRNLFFIIFATFIRRIVNPSFMNSFIGREDSYNSNVDYIKNDLHITYEKVVENMGVAYCQQDDFVRFQDGFNGMLFYATSNFYNNEATFYDRGRHVNFDIAECKKLKDLIIKYAGEKYICE